MRLDDHMMTVLTGLVFAFVLGTMAQNSDSLSSLFADDGKITVSDDVFFVRAGGAPTLDILANDSASITSDDIRIVSAPSCGAIETGENGLVFGQTDSCVGKVSFAYCIEHENGCKEANVTLNVRKAPMAVADAYIPDAGTVVPLSPLKSKVANASQIAVPELKALVVTFEDATIAQNTDADVNHYIYDTKGLDLAEAAIAADESVISNSVDVPLSATRTARFIVDVKKGADVFPKKSIAVVEVVKVAAEETFIQFIQDDSIKDLSAR